MYDVFGEEFLIGVASPLVSRLEKQFGYELNDNSFGEIPAELNEDLAKDITSKLPDACAKRNSWSDVIADIITDLESLEQFQNNKKQSCTT